MGDTIIVWYLTTVILLTGLSSTTAKAVSSPPPPSPPPTPPVPRDPNPPSPPGNQLPLSPDNCDLVLVFNTTTGEYDIMTYRQSFRLTIRTSWSAIATGVGNASRLERFVNDTRDALALVFHVSSDPYKRLVSCMYGVLPAFRV